jgi:hypothetical protein
MLDPTFRLLRALRNPCYRLLQALPVFLVLTVAAWFTVTLNYVAAHPELLVDIFFGALSGLPKYCDYAGQRILDRLLSKVSGSFWNSPETSNHNATALEPGTPSFTIHWWLLGIPIAVFLSKGWGVGWGQTTSLFPLPDLLWLSANHRVTVIWRYKWSQMGTGVRNHGIIAQTGAPKWVNPFLKVSQAS